MRAICWFGVAGQSSFEIKKIFFKHNYKITAGVESEKVGQG